MQDESRLATRLAQQHLRILAAYLWHLRVVHGMLPGVHAGPSGARRHGTSGGSPQAWERFSILGVAALGAVNGCDLRSISFGQKILCRRGDARMAGTQESTMSRIKL